MTSKDFAIGVLSITAVVLFAALLIVQVATPQQAMAYAQSASAGDLLVTTAQLDDTTELLVILDSVQQKMNVYGFDPQVAQVQLIQQVDVAPLQRLVPPRPAAPGRR